MENEAGGDREGEHESKGNINENVSRAQSASRRVQFLAFPDGAASDAIGQWKITALRSRL